MGATFTMLPVILNGTYARFLGAEIGNIGIMSAVICAGLLLALDHYASDLVRMLFFR
jgi:hypothetical protein